MDEREEFISKMKAAYAAMAENEQAHQRYVKAEDEANSLFCLFSNKFGFRPALKAKQDALADSLRDVEE
ncbi:hypothetical protein [Streptomyces sp. WG5]|uniref:hypothetical protein n=1 Tax=Streptomyces sp. WG5 TaxID=3417648 RepID=UPI003CF32AFB